MSLCPVYQSLYVAPAVDRDERDRIIGDWKLVKAVCRYASKVLVDT
jgi:hypothetical protein